MEHAKSQNGFRNILSIFSKVDLLALVILCSTTFFMNADSGIISPNLSKIANDFGLNENQRDFMIGGQLSFISSVTAGISSITVGWFSANGWDTCKLLIMAILIGKVPALFSQYVATFNQLITLRIFDGILNGSGFPLVLALMAETFKVSKRNLLAGMVHLCYGLGGSIGLTSIAFFSDSLDWKLFFVLTAIPSLCTAFALLTFHKFLMKGQEHVTQINQETRSGKNYKSGSILGFRSYFSKVILVVTTKTNFFCYLISVSACAYWGMNGTFVIDFIRERGLGVQGGSTLMLIFGLGTKTGAITGGFLAQCLYNKRPEHFARGFGVLRYCSLVPLLAMLNYDYAQSAQVLKETNWLELKICAICFVGGWMAGMPGPQVGATIMNATPSDLRPLALTLLVLTDSTGSAIGPMLAGSLMPFFGREVVLNGCTLFWWILSGSCFMAVSCFIRADVRNATRKEEATKDVHDSEV